MEDSVEQSPACASSASAGQLNHHPSTPDPHQLRQQPSEPHAARGPFQGAGVGHRACAVARSNEYSDKGKGARNGRSGNEKGHAQSDAGASTYSHPPCPGSHLKPRRSGKEPAVSSRAATTPAPALSSSSRSVTTIASRLLQPGPSPQHNSSRRSNRVVFHQETLIFNPNPYFHPTQNYFHGFTPRYNPYNRYYSLISSAMPSSSSILSSPIQNDEQPSHQTRLEEKCLELGLPKPYYQLMSDPRGARTAWSCTVTVGDFPPTPARYWYSGHYNAYEDAAEVMLKIILDYVDKYGCTWKKVRRPSLQTAGPPIPCVARVSTFSPGNYANYTHNYTHSSPPQGGGHGYGTIGTGIGPGTCNTYPQSQSHSPVNVARGKPYVSSSFGG